MHALLALVLAVVGVKVTHGFSSLEYTCTQIRKKSALRLLRVVHRKRLDLDLA